MAVAINMPGKKEEKDPLDKLAAALNVARTIYGIKHDATAIENAKLEKEKADKLRELQTKKLESEMAQSAEDDNPNSPLMGVMRAAAQKRGLTIPDGMTPRQARTNFDAFMKPNDPKQKDPLAEEMARARLDEMRSKKEHGKSVQGRLEKLNSGDKARFDNSTLGLQSIQSMDSALQNGDWTFSLVGDNDYTRNLQMAAEAFGRMQSGGAINKDEEARFLKMSPTASDSKEQQRKKLIGMQKLFVDRLRTLGFTPDEAGVPAAEIMYAKAENQDDNSAGKVAGGAAPPKAKTVMQNGHTYTLNPKTGQYE